MATKTTLLASLFVQFAVILSSVGSYLDFEELSSIHYGIEIVKEPVLMGQTESQNPIMLTSIYGQQYQCTYPDHSAKDQKVKEEEKVAMEVGISDLLKPMEEGPCLIHTKEWWTYEFCFGKYIKQYHVEDGKPSGNIMFLGYYESEFDWNNSTQKASKNHLNRYHTQQYVNGSICDLTGKLRRTEVRFMCAEGEGDYIAHLDEPETCVYILNVYTTKICHHPYLKSITPHKSIPITCNPLLTHEQYSEYQQHKAQQAVEEQTQNAEVLRQAELKKEYEEQLKKHQEKEAQDAKNKGQSTDDKDTNKMVDTAMDALQRLFTDSLTKGLQEVLDEQGLPDQEQQAKDRQLNLNLKDIKVFRDPKEFEDYMEEHHGKKAEQLQDDSNESPRFKVHIPADDNKKQDKTPAVHDNVDKDELSDVDTKTDVEKSDTSDEIAETTTIQPTDEVETEQEELDPEALEEFDRALDEITDQGQLQREQLAKYKDTVESAVQAQFSNIVDEAQQELENEGFTGDINKKEAFSKLAKTLSQLLQRLENTQNKIKEIDEDIQKAEERRDKAKQEYSEVEEENIEEEDEDTDVVQEDSTTEEETSEEVVSSDTPDTQSDTLDNRVRVRVTRVKSGQQNRAADDKRTLQIPPKQKEQLENSVKNELEKAGMETEGRKIEVKIITAGYYDDDNTLHVLNEADSTAFNKMIITILGGNQNEQREMERQHNMEDAYSFTWGNNKNKKEKDNNQL